jgi:hypothetical protein
MWDLPRMKLHHLKMHQLSVPPCKSDMSVLMQNLESRMQCNSTVVQYPMVAAFQVDQLVTLARPYIENRALGLGYCSLSSHGNTSQTQKHLYCPHSKY